MPDFGVTRRTLLEGTAAAGLASSLPFPASAQFSKTVTIPREPGEVVLAVNGHSLTLRIEPRTSLLDALREYAGLTGTKKGCDRGSCGACTVHIDGKRVNACLTLAIRCEGKKITTVEGLATGDALHPMQASFVEHDAFQCGYCTPGQLMSAVALVGEGHAHDDPSIREWMSGNICRCGAYSNIVAAIKDAAPLMTAKEG